MSDHAREVDADAPSAPAYKYRAIAARLRADMAAGRIKPGQALPPQGRLCQKFGVALSTVRQALAELGDEGLIRAEHGRGFFVCQPFGERSGPAPSAPPVHPVPREHLRRVGFWLWDDREPSEPWALAILRGAAAHLTDHGCELGFGSFRIRDARQAQQLLEFSARYEGLIVTGWVNAALLKELLGDRQRVVLASHTTDQTGAELFPCVHEHVEAGAALGVQMLVMHGHRNLAVITKQGTTLCSGWLGGAQEACTEAGLPEPVLVPITQPDDEAGIARNLVQRRRITAALVMGDQAACRIIRHLRELGVRVPEDMSIVASGSLPRADLQVPGLSRVWWDAQRIGREAAQMILSPSAVVAHRWVPCRIEMGATIARPGVERA